MKKFYRTVLSIALLTVLLGSLVFFLTSCRFSQPPVANIATDPSPPEVDVDVDIEFDASGSTDPDGTITSYDWDWGDGTVHGTQEVQTHSYTPASDYLVTLTVTDDSGLTGTATVTVDVDVD